MSTIFSKIIQREIPSHTILEDDQFYAFLDIRPIYDGHTLVIPKIEVDRFFDLPNHLLERLFLFAKPIAEAIERVVPCQRVGVMVAGLEVPHAHVHLVPIQTISGLSFEHAKPASNDHLANLAKKIRYELHHQK